MPITVRDKRTGKVVRFSDGTRPEDISAALAQIPEPHPVRDALLKGARFHNKNLPLYGAGLGAAIGTPALAAGQAEVPIGLAMAGAAGGKLLEQALNPALGVEGPGLASGAESVAPVANAASLAGVTEGAPQAVIAAGKTAAGTVARQQMAKALSAAKPVLKRFDDVVGDALAQGATVNRWFGRGGAAAAEQVRKDATGRVVGLLRAATRKGYTIDPEEVAQPIIAAVEKKAGPLGVKTNAMGIPVDEKQALLDRVQNRIDELLMDSVMGATHRSSNAMSPLMADELRKAAARKARAALTAEATTGLTETAIPDMDRLIAKGAANAVRRIRGVSAARLAEQKAIGVSRAISAVEKEPLQAAKSIGVGPIHIGMGATPGIGSRLALLANGASAANPMIGPTIANIIRALQVVGSTP